MARVVSGVVLDSFFVLVSGRELPARRNSESCRAVWTQAPSLKSKLVAQPVAISNMPRLG
jgi:hypothetical protein